MAKNKDKTKLNTNRINPDERQVAYWQERAERNFLAGEKEAFQIAKDLKANYKVAIDEIEKEINAFYGKYASKEGMTLEEAKVVLNKGEKKNFKSLINDMLKMGKKEDFTDAQMKEFKRIYTKARITRLDELETNIKYQLDILTNANNEQIGELLKNTYENQYYKTVFDAEQFRGYSSSFSGLNNKAVEKAVSTKWLGSNYSERIWQNENNLMTTLNQELPRGLALGYNPRKLAKQVSNKLDSNYNNTVRLLRTEYNKVQTDATIAGYKAAGIKQYQILATLDSRTSDICRAMNDEIFNVDEAETGVNCPPFHPNCRTTTIAYFEEDEFDKMSEAELDEYLENLDTLGWLKDLVEQKNGKLQYENPNPINYQPVDIHSEPMKLLENQAKNLFENKLKNYEINSINSYTRGYYKEINRYMRNNDSVSGDFSDEVSGIRSAMDKFKLPDNIITYRGTYKQYYDKLNIGDEFIDKAFNSTSLNKKIANHFAVTNNNEGGYLLEIRVPKDTNCLYIGEKSGFINERELLLDGGLTYKVISKSEKGMVLEIVNK